MYPPEIRQTILERMSQGESLHSICRDDDMPGLSSVMRWLDSDAEFREQYTRAMLLRADIKFEELDSVSETAATCGNAAQIAGLRLKADNIKWQLARMNAKKYGDKLTTEVNGNLNHRHAVELQPETARLLESLSTGSGDPGAAPPVPD